MSTIAETLPGYVAYLKRAGRSEKTLNNYSRLIGELAQWAGDRDLNEIDLHGIELLYLPWWEEQFEERHGRKPAPGYARLHINVLRSFYDFLDRYDLLEGKNPMRRIVAPRLPRKRNDWLSPEEDQALLEAATSDFQRIFIFLLRFTGLRISEALSLRNADVALSQNTITVRESKTEHGLRTLPILPELRGVLCQWMLLQKAKGFGGPGFPVLTTANGKPVRMSSAWRTLKRVARRAGVRSQESYGDFNHNYSEISAHTLRRTFGSDLLNRGVRLEVVSKCLGHASTTITEQAYAELLDATIVTEVLSASGLLNRGAPMAVNLTDDLLARQSENRESLGAKQYRNGR